LASILVLRTPSLTILHILDTENREQRRGIDKQRRIDEVPPRADTPSITEGRRQQRIITQTTIWVKEPFRLEGIGLGIDGRIMKNPPAET